ncbi:BnaC09g12210D [Brassica napus]|uniref:BnaC09g12210D protein n=1 Tax=Brassica napus TaxID=3708 RepID=A0A078F1N5_BRANA|nr:BnaC09g12210D [Brassica napus]
MSASGNCLSSLPCNLKVDGRSQYLCQPTVDVISSVLFAYLKAGCPSGSAS